MEITAGYLKDLLASITFIILIIIINKIYKKEGTKEFLIIYFLFAFALDFTYSVYPEYHNMVIGYNRPTYLIVLVAIFLFYFFTIYILY
jgi:hypothetical protein